MFQKDFAPFPPEKLGRIISELQNPETPLPPVNKDERVSVRGYAEINRLYQAACFDNRRRQVRMSFNPSDPQDRRTLNGLQREFNAELAALTKRYDIPEHGYSSSVQDRSIISAKGVSEYYLRFEILDGNLRPAIITDGCVQSFSSAPVAFFATWDPYSRERFAQPIFTLTGFRELVRTLASTPLDQLKLFPSPNFAFLKICGALARHADAQHRSKAGLRIEDAERDLLSVQLPQDGQYRNYASRFLDSDTDYEATARDILKLQVQGSSYAPRVSVLYDLGYDLQSLDIDLKRSYRYGWVSATVRGGKQS